MPHPYYNTNVDEMEIVKDDWMELQGVRYKTGDRITCDIMHEYVDDAKIIVIKKEHFNQINSGTIASSFFEKDWVAFVCQDERDGRHVKNKLGYKFAYTFSNYLINPNIFTGMVTNLKKVETDCLAEIVNLAFPIRIKKVLNNTN